MWPLFKKMLPLILVAIYLLSPLDLVPDLLVGPGWIDDLVLICLLILFLSGRSIPFFNRFGTFRSGKKRHDEGTSREYSRSSTKPDDDYGGTVGDPYKVLGIRRGATKEEIREAYRIAAAKYHPDKVSHLGKEFQKLAHKKFVTIQEAYERLTKVR